MDLSRFMALRDGGFGVVRIARELGCKEENARKLLEGLHWQQDAAKVRAFNKMMGANVAEDTGIPTSDDLARFGVGLSPERPLELNKPVSAKVKKARAALRDVGVKPAIRDEVVRRMGALGGDGSLEATVPGRMDTALFLGMVEDRLYMALKTLDSTVMAAASPKDLSAMVSMLIEKRNLLKGEPTAIVRNEHRGGLAEVAKLLLAEVARRGLTIEGMATDVTPVGA